MRRFALLLALLAAACAKAPPPDPGKPESYAVRLAVTPAEGETLQRVEIPLVARAAQREASDFRIFDGNGRVLPTFSAMVGDVPHHPIRTSVPVYPIRGNARPTVSGAMRIVLDGGEARIEGASTPSDSATAQQVGALLDTRKLAGPALEAALEVELPRQQLVAVTLETSSDLATWQPLAQDVLFRPDDSHKLLNGGRIDLGGADLRGKYVRLSWSEDAPVTVERAVVETSSESSQRWLSIPTTGARLVSSHDLRFSLKDQINVQALRVTLRERGALIPARLQVRESDGTPWRPVAAAVLQDGPKSMSLNEQRLHEFRIEADSRTAGFSDVPTIELLIPPLDVLAKFNASPPFTLTAGLAGAPSGELPGGFLNIAPVPNATVSNSGHVLPTSIAPAEVGQFASKRLALWAALLAGTAVLAYAVWRLMRGGNRAVKDDNGLRHPRPS